MPLPLLFLYIAGHYDDATADNKDITPYKSMGLCFLHHEKIFATDQEIAIAIERYVCYCWTILSRNYLLVVVAFFGQQPKG